ncbi:unnamed protein product [Knipowitschia caucasica]|uniref:Uncharacterized protein n=1 Tax=Knipowitschia caucasica TaxID=637954 RepID=A0AAV2L6T6_KNICA
MKVLSGCLQSKNLETCCTGASALWALLHNNQRAKASLKCPLIRLKLEEAYTSTRKDKAQKENPMRIYLMKCLENLSQLLKN